MIAFPVMLVAPAQEAGIKVPDDPETYDPQQFKHFHLFCCAQLGISMPNSDSHWKNAKVIAGIKEEEIETVTIRQLADLGFEI